MATPALAPQFDELLEPLVVLLFVVPVVPALEPVALTPVLVKAAPSASWSPIFCSFSPIWP